MRGLSSVPQPKSGQPSTDINLNDVSKFGGSNHFLYQLIISFFFQLMLYDKRTGKLFKVSNPVQKFLQP